MICGYCYKSENIDDYEEALRRALNLTRNELKHREMEITALEKIRTEQKFTVHTLENDKRELNRIITDLRTLNRKLQDDLKILERDNEELKEKINKINSQNLILKNDVRSLKENMERIEKIIECRKNSDKD